MTNYFDSFEPGEYQELLNAEAEAFAEHWANDFLDSPETLIVVIETKMARAVMGREREIIKLLQDKGILCSEKDRCWLGQEYKCDCENVMPKLRRSQQ